MAPLGAGHKTAGANGLITHYKAIMAFKRKRSKGVGAAKRKPILDVRDILVPVDFSENAEAAVESAGQFAEKFGATIHLLHVVEPAPFITDLSNVPFTLSDKQLALKAETDLEALALRFIPPSVPVVRSVRRGKAHHEITEAAKELPADLIIVSTHGYTGLKHTLMGSTAERIVRHAICPVLVVRTVE
jgi:universal stress protein A